MKSFVFFLAIAAVAFAQNVKVLNLDDSFSKKVQVVENLQNIGDNDLAIEDSEIFGDKVQVVNDSGASSFGETVKIIKDYGFSTFGDKVQTVEELDVSSIDGKVQVVDSSVDNVQTEVLGALPFGNPFEDVEASGAMSFVGYLKDVAIPMGAARKKAEEEAMRSASSRIVAGTPAVLGQIPWQAGLVSDIIGLEGNGICGASLISNNRLITAAHCWFDGINQGWRVSVVLGSVLLFGSDGVRQQTSVVVPHPQWTPSLLRNDVAIIYLGSPVPLSSTIAPVSIPTAAEADHLFVGESAVASGFGLTGNSHDITAAQFLSHSRMDVIDNSVCYWTGLPIVVIVQPSNICARGGGISGVCRGDSGGPLVVSRGGRNILVGITSFGNPNCDLPRPSVFARVSSFISFINQHL